MKSKPKKKLSSMSSKKSKSPSVRILWIPGGKKSHPKGRYSATNKNVSYSSAQKKSEVWTLGGSKTQSELFTLPTPTTPDVGGGGASTSLALLGTASCTLSQSIDKLSQNSSDSLMAENLKQISECATLPVTPIGTQAPPTPHLDNSTMEQSTSKILSSPVVATVEILNMNNSLAVDDLPKVPSFSETDLSTSALVLNSSAGTTASITTTATTTTATSSPIVNRKEAPPTSSSNASSPQKTRYNLNNNQEDINSIENLYTIQKIPEFANFDWIDEMVQQRNCNELMHKNKRKKLKKAQLNKESDQLDGVFLKKAENAKENAKQQQQHDKDEKIVKCLYFSLMCCDCTIS